MSGRNQFVGIVIFQLVELEMAALADAKGFGKQFGWIELGELLARPQVAFAIGKRWHPASATGRWWRMAVMQSCNARRPRACMCTSPQATAGMPRREAWVRDCRSCSASSGPDAVRCRARGDRGSARAAIDLRCRRRRDRAARSPAVPLATPRSGLRAALVTTFLGLRRARVISWHKAW